MTVVLLSLGFNLLAIAIIYIIFRRKINRVLDGRELIDTIKDEVNHLVVELNQTTERNIGIIEERITRLQKLVREADRKIMLLGKESEKVKFGAEVYDRLKKAAPFVHVVDPTEEDEPESLVETSSSERSSAEEVLELHRQGFDSRIVAARTGLTVGEVELIISLSDREV